MAKKSEKKSTKKKGTKLGKLRKVKNNEKKGKIKNFDSKKKTKTATGTIKLPTDFLGRIGNFGKTITFVVSEKETLTFSEMNRSVAARWTTHPAIKKREKTEFLGPDLAKITMNVILDYSLGVKPRSIISKLEKAACSGTVENLVIGGKKIGVNKYRITDLSENWDTIIRNGGLYRATVTVTFEEYVE